MQTLATLVHTISTTDLSRPLNRWLPALESCHLTPSDHAALAQVLLAPNGEKLWGDTTRLDAYGASLSEKDNSLGIWQPWI